MTLFLQGGGSYPVTEKMDREFFSSTDSEKKILYIAVAPVVFDRQRCADEIEEILSSLQIQRSFEICGDLSHFKEKDFSEYGGIFFCGGYTFRLLDEIRKNNLEEKLLSFHEQGGNVYGKSAGTIIFGKDIQTASSQNLRNLKDTKGFGVIQNYSFWCHYVPKNDATILEYMQYHPEDIIALSEESGIKYENNQITCMGTSPVAVFKKGEKKIYQPGEKVE